MDLLQLSHSHPTQLQDSACKKNLEEGTRPPKAGWVYEMLLSVVLNYCISWKDHILYQAACWCYGSGPEILRSQVHQQQQILFPCESVGSGAHISTLNAEETPLSPASDDWTVDSSEDQECLEELSAKLSPQLETPLSRKS